jgi:hypothetical protein
VFGVDDPGGIGHDPQVHFAPGLVQLGGVEILKAVAVPGGFALEKNSMAKPNRASGKRGNCRYE